MKSCSTWTISKVCYGLLGRWRGWYPYGLRMETTLTALNAYPSDVSNGALLGRERTGHTGADARAELPSAVTAPNLLA